MSRRGTGKDGKSCQYPDEVCENCLSWDCKFTGMNITKCPYHMITETRMKERTPINELLQTVEKSFRKAKGNKRN